MLYLSLDFWYTKLILIILDEIEAVGLICNFENFAVFCIKISIADVLFDCLIEEERLLHHDSYLLSEVLYRKAFDVLTIDEDFAARFVIEPQEQRSNGTLSRSRLANKGYGLVTFDL